MKLTPRVGGERGSAVAPVLWAGGSGGGSGQLRERGWHGRELPLPLPFSTDRPRGRFPHCPGGQGQPWLLCLLSAGRVWVTGLLWPHLHSCHLSQPSPRREERVWLCLLRGLPAAFPLLLKMTRVGGDAGGSGGQEAPGAAAQPSPARRGCRAAGAALGSAQTAVNECHWQKEKQKLPPKIAKRSLARLLKTPISKG